MSDLKPNIYASIEDSFEPEIPTGILEIQDWILTEMGRREPDTHINRASSALLCPKRRWFQKNGFPGKPLAPRKITNFALGEIIEYLIKYYIKNASVGPGKRFSRVDFGVPTGSFLSQGKEIDKYDQQKLEATIAGFINTAHVDGWGERNSDGQWELIEVKSMSNYSYADFKENGPGEYLKQAMVNLSTTRAKELGAKEVHFYVMRKETGAMWDSIHPFDPEVMKKVERELWLANQKEQPDSPFHAIDEKFRSKPTGRKIVGFPCNYCPYVSNCFKFDLDWKAGQFGNKSPVYVVKE